MMRVSSVFLAIILLCISQVGFSADFYAMGCKPGETPKHVATKPAEKALPPARKQLQAGLSAHETAPKKLREVKSDHSRVSHRETARKKPKEMKSNRLQQIAAFRIRRNAKSLVKKLKEEGYEAIMRKSVTKNKKQVYKVLVSKSKWASKRESVLGETRHKDRLQELPPEEKPAVVEQFPEKQKELQKDTLSSSEIRYDSVSENKLPEEQTVRDEKIAVEQKLVSRDISHSGDISQETAPVQQPTEEMPIGVTGDRSSWDVFGTGGYVHPFLSVSEYFTDNALYTHENRISDFITTISPGIWLTVPHVNERLLNISTASVAPGGFSLSRYKPETFKRYQTYLFYNADIEQYAKESSENAVSHNAGAFFQYNLRGGLTLEVLDQYVKSYDNRATVLTNELDKYWNNLASFTGMYDVSDRLQLRLDYSYFLVNYLADRNDFRNRNDSALSGYLFYKFRPKTSLFAEYEFVDIRYDKDTVSNSREHHFFGGIQWDITAKSKGSIKAGYGTKEFTRTGIGNSNDFILEAQIDHKLTAKTSLLLKASRRTNETNISTANYMITDSVGLGYLHRLTAKLMADINLEYGHDKYNGDVTLRTETGKLTDHYFSAAFAMQYKLREWLEADAGYIFGRRSSNFPDFDYITNIIFLRITGSL
jgi:hypothetical protein